MQNYWIKYSHKQGITVHDHSHQCLWSQNDLAVIPCLLKYALFQGGSLADSMDWCGQRSDTSSHLAGSTHNRHTPNQRGGFSWPGGPPMQGFTVSLFHLLLDFQTHKYLIVVSQLDWIQFYCIDIEKNQDGLIFFQSQFSFPGVPSFPNFTGPLPHSSVSI